MSSRAIKLFKALADRSRMSIVNALLEQPMYVEMLANRLGLSPSTISFHLKKLVDAQLVTAKKEQYYTMYQLRPEILKASLREMISIEGSEQTLQDQRVARYRQKTIETFLQYGQLVTIPKQRKKRLIILEELAKEFVLDRDYPEKEVNEILGRFHEDICTLRREMIIEKIMTRHQGVYRLIAKK